MQTLPFDEISEPFERSAQVKREIIDLMEPLLERLSQENPVPEDEIAAVRAFLGMAIAMAAHFRGELSDDRFNEIRREYGEPSDAYNATVERMLHERTNLTDDERFMLGNRNVALTKTFDEFEARVSGNYLRWIFDDMNVLARRHG